jgi:hypothetical protein
VDPQQVLIPLFGILLVMIPVAGLTLIMTMRFALKPFVEAMARALRESGVTGGTDLHVRLEALSEQVRALTGEVEGLRQAHDFDRKLLAGKGTDRVT